MDELTRSKSKGDEHCLTEASVETTYEYQTKDGSVTERTTLNFKSDSGNVIDNAIDEIRESEYVKKIGNSAQKAVFSIAKLSLILGAIGMVLFLLAIMGGVIQ